MKFSVILDLDEVLTDFVGSTCTFFGTNREEVTKHWPIGTWEMVKPLSMSLYGDPNRLTEEMFWNALEGHTEFWTNLPKTPWFDELLKIVSTFDPDFFIVSSPSYCESCYAGKVTWLKREFGSKFNRFTIHPYKEKYANKYNILIDDSDSNIGKFEAAGGWVCPFPTYHNSLFNWRDKPLEIVIEGLHYIQNPD